MPYYHLVLYFTRQTIEKRSSLLLLVVEHTTIKRSDLSLCVLTERRNCHLLMDWTRIDKQALKRSIEIQLAVGGGLWMDHIEGCFNYFEWFPYGGIYIGTGKQVVHLIALLFCAGFWPTQTAHIKSTKIVMMRFGRKKTYDAVWWHAGREIFSGGYNPHYDAHLSHGLFLTAHISADTQQRWVTRTS